MKTGRNLQLAHCPDSGFPLERGKTDFSSTLVPVKPFLKNVASRDESGGELCRP